MTGSASERALSDDSLAPGALRIDRARFLLLTAAIAGGACGGPRVPAPEPVRIPGDYDTTDPGGAQPVEPGTGAPVVARADAGEQPGAVAGGVLGPTAEADIAAAAPEIPIDPACGSLKQPDPGCESPGFDKGHCSTLKSFMEPAPADKLVKCLVQGSTGKGQCPLVSALEDCPKKLLKGVRKLDAGSAQICKPIVQACSGAAEPGFTVARCQALLSVIKPESEPSAITCMTEGCGTTYCFSQLAWQSLYGTSHVE